ncbi:MAG: AAA family ATPase [Myxococcales bacterium]|nr:AAA family ATPase [Myxococcales bacterium]
MGTTLLADHIRPIGLADPFGQRPAAATLRTAAESLPAPGCLALYGGWGAGKTTLLRDLYEGWAPGRRVWFDPWLYERRQDVLTPLLTAIVEATTEQHRGEKANEIRKKAGALLRVLATLTAQAVWGRLVGGDWSKALEKLDPVKDGREALAKLGQVHDAVRHARDRFRELVEVVCPAPTDRLLICLDDLDRCLPASVVQLIEAVKLLLCGADSYTFAGDGPAVQCRAVFVFALDRQIVGEAIRDQYPKASLYTGENYLEKIFDLSLEAPPITQVQIKDFVHHQLDEAERGRLARAFSVRGQLDVGDGLSQVLATGAFANPRVTVRILNRIKLLLADEARVDQLGAALDNATMAKRFLAWVAGVERYRTFRHFFRRASTEELRLLGEHCRGRLDAYASQSPREATAEIVEFIHTPGFLGFAQAVASDTFDFAAQRTSLDEWSPGQPLSTLTQFDDLLRRAGL